MNGSKVAVQLGGVMAAIAGHNQEKQRNAAFECFKQHKTSISRNNIAFAISLR